MLADIRSRDLGDVPAIIEGPQFMPAFADPVPPGWAVWLLPDPARTRVAYEERLRHEEAPAGRPAAGRTRLTLVSERNAILVDRIRAGAAARGRPAIEVPSGPDWAVIAAETKSALATGLRFAPRLSPGTAVSQQRRYENRAAEHQGRASRDSPSRLPTRSAASAAAAAARRPGRPRPTSTLPERGRLWFTTCKHARRTQDAALVGGTGGTYRRARDHQRVAA